jgi:hypothetical protein
MDEEMLILSDLDTTDIFKMRNRIKNYILNNVQLSRVGMEKSVKNLQEKLK